METLGSHSGLVDDVLSCGDGTKFSRKNVEIVLEKCDSLTLALAVVGLTISEYATTASETPSGTALTFVSQRLRGSTRLTLGQSPGDDYSALSSVLAGSLHEASLCNPASVASGNLPLETAYVYCALRVAGAVAGTGVDAEMSLDRKTSWMR
jgi:hypothetical protein